MYYEYSIKITKKQSKINQSNGALNSSQILRLKSSWSPQGFEQRDR
jgi:hypothetical protein